MSTSAALRDELKALDDACHRLKAKVSKEFGPGSPEYVAVYEATKPLCDLVLPGRIGA